MLLSIPYSRYIFYPIPWYSFLIVLGASLAIMIATKEERRLGIKKDTVIDLALFLLPAGIIGARVYYVIFSWPQFQNDILSVFRIWEGGLAIYGGIIAGLITIVIFCKKRHLSALLLCDIIVPGLALAQSIGRWGNYFNMEAYGYRITNPLFCFFPVAVQIPSDGDAWHLATFFYESLWDLIIFVLLVTFRKRVRHKTGSVFLAYSFLYACGRFVIEDLRMDSLYTASSVRISQLLSAIICFTVIIYCHLAAKKNHIQRSFNGLLMVICSLSIIPMLVYSLFPSYFSFLEHNQKVLLLILLSIILIIVFFSYYIKLFVTETDHADNKA